MSETFHRYLILCKPRVVVLIVFTAVVGMFLAVPLTMVVKVMLDTSDDFQWISVAMGKARPEHHVNIADSEARALEGSDNEIAGA